MGKKQWYVIYSKPRCEKKVDIALRNKEIESWCPVVTVKKQWSDRVKKVQEPLFKSYVFVFIEFEKERDAVRNTPGVLQFVHYLKKPAIIRDSEVEEIKSYLCLDNVDIKVSPASEFNVNDDVIISRGVFKDNFGKIVKQTNKKVYVQIQSLGQVMTIEFGVESLKAAK